MDIFEYFKSRKDKTEEERVQISQVARYLNLWYIP